MDIAHEFDESPYEAPRTRRTVEGETRATEPLFLDAGSSADVSVPSPLHAVAPVETEAGEGPERVRMRRPSQVRAKSRGGVGLYERMGGAVALRRLVRRFSELMATLPEAEAARVVLHVAPADLGPKLYEFLSGWLGGPELYTKRHGAPKLKRRHFLVPIGPAQRDAWLLCFRMAATETITDAAVVEELLPQIESLAHYLAARD